ncbi:AbrB/MazE/SpoVT family DNA-binding domain-containing protein [Nanoarchaeota archaeon]
MKRKIIKQGHNTLTMTLPSDWVKKQGLSAGEEVDLIETDNSLIINGDGAGEPKKAEINIKDFTIPLLWRYFQAAYRAGCDEIKIVFDTSKKKYQDAYHYYTTQFDYAKLGEKLPPKPGNAMIQEVVNRFIGVDILESGEKYCLVKELGGVSPKEFETSLRRIFLVIIQMFDRVYEAIEKNQIGDPTLCKEIHTIDLNVDKFVDYCARILNKTNTKFSDKEKQLIFSSLFLLELVGDEFKYIGKHIATSEKSLKDVLPMVTLAKDHFNMYHSLYYKFDREQSLRFGAKDAELYETGYKLKYQLTGDSKSIHKHLMLVSKFTLSLMELRTQMEF